MVRKSPSAWKTAILNGSGPTSGLEKCRAKSDRTERGNRQIQGVVAYFYDPSCLESKGGESWSKASLSDKCETLSEKQLKQKGLGVWLKCRVPAKQAQGPEFKLQYPHQKKKKVYLPYTKNRKNLNVLPEVNG
jgi:hypothetical protein